MSTNDLPLLNPLETRVLGCLAEKKTLTPDVYPMSLNGVHGAANQKTARDPVMTPETVEVRRALAQLQDKGLVRQAFASRVERYEHLMAQRFSLTQGQTALIALMMLRGPQTARELLTRTERMASYGSLDDLLADLDLLIGRRPALVQLVERGPGQREDRYMHLLSGPVAATAYPARAAPVQTATHTAASSDLEARVSALEEQVSELRRQLAVLTGNG
ncbi:DUF480 domain-containing protein [Nitratireductor sp. CAU 1489]|uniref:DUF480 domain-containing protein n=1 Tax=Nitratireductor arenosus TaxID=2682096 RepID=A0A844QC23_9HYPH|nr:DUF480 domain-containing protein [Nitratireductor arenosus]MVA96527.1 DUF480 domain-containing protein [Nitratireductor arenosus]